MDETRVLDKGFVRLVDFMGGDQAVVEAARVSYAGVSKGPEKDKKLLFFLMEHNHGTPFEQTVFKFHVKTPIFVARQWMRHRMASYNEISYRYTETKEEFYIPTEWRVQDDKNKQSSKIDSSLENELLSSELKLICNESYSFYQRFLKKGISREMARMMLPVNMFTQFYWTVNSRSLMNFINLRADVDAQYEIRQYAEAHAQFFKLKSPWTYEAFLKLGWKGKNDVLDDTSQPTLSK